MNKETNIENLYKKAATETSPKDLDNLILAQAKANCDKNFIISRVGKRTWLYGISTAAVFVMGLSMIFNLQTINDQAMLPIDLEKSIDQGQSRKSKAAKTTVRKQSNETRQKLDLKAPVIKTNPIPEPPMPQAVKMEVESIQEFFPFEETLQEESMQEEKDKLTLSHSSKTINTENEADETNHDSFSKLTLSRAKKATTPNNEGGSQIDANSPEKKSVTTNSPEPFEQSETTSDDATSAIDENESQLAPTQKKTAKTFELRDDLNQFLSLIEQNKKQQAKELLERLSQEYPGYDFKIYYEFLKNFN